MATGLTNTENAAHLFLGVETVKTHVSHILNKLRVPDRTQAVIAAYDSGLIRPGDPHTKNRGEGPTPPPPNTPTQASSASTSARPDRARSRTPTTSAASATIREKFTG